MSPAVDAKSLVGANAWLFHFRISCPGASATGDWAITREDAAPLVGALDQDRIWVVGLRKRIGQGEAKEREEESSV